MPIRKPDAERLKWISGQCRARIEMSRTAMAKRYSQWRRNEEAFAAYVPETDADAVRAGRRDNGEPAYTTLHIPYSYAIAMTAHTYYTSVFMARNPVLQVAGRHGESEQQTQAIEALLDYQLQVGEMLVPLFLWLFDPVKYGFGVIGHYWDEETVQCRRRVTRPRTFLGIELPGTEETIEAVEQVVGYAGHKNFNVRPQDCFPDPRVSLWNFQKGKFFGRYVELPYEDALAGERNGKYFDIKLARSGGDGDYNYLRDEGSPAVRDLPGAGEGYLPGPEDVPKFLKCYELYVRLIPREWKLADSEQEEIWVFTLTADSFRVLGIQPLGLYHGRYPFDIIEQEPEAYDLFSRSMMEVMAPLNDAINWLVNSHMFNVRSALNNMFVVDPSMVVMKDVESPEPGKLIRLKPAAYGRDIRTFMTQFPVQDVTGQHVPNMQLMADMLQRVTGVTDNVMGMVNAGGRKTATEVRQSTSFGINRLKTSCEYFSIMGWAPMTQKLVQSTQQFYTMDRQFRIAGDLAIFGEQFARVTPESIAGFFDFVPVDGTMPVDRFAQANLWQMMIAQMAKVPQVMGQYDLGKIFGWVANLAGLRNLQRFRVQMGSPEQLAAMAQAGNVVPLKQNMADFARPPGQGQDSGMGLSL